MNSAVSRFHATMTMCSDMAFPPEEMIGHHRSRPDYPRLPAGGPMIASGEGRGAWRPEPDADPERTILRPDHIEDRPRSGCKIEKGPRASSPRSSGIGATEPRPGRH